MPTECATCARIVEGERELFIIVSAMGKTTNALERVFDACAGAMRKPAGTK